MANMKTTRIGILGCGALGSRIALGLARPNTSLFLVDDDKVESDNIGTSIYGRRDEGKFKVKALLEHIDSVIGRSVVDISARRFPSKPIIKILEDYNVIVDCFDNAESRNSITACKSPVCHVALASPDYGEVIWHRDFIVIEDERVGFRYYDPPNSERVCTHLLGAGIISLVADIAVHSILGLIDRGETLSYAISLGRDIKISRI